jgi:hypothetical protein
MATGIYLLRLADKLTFSKVDLPAMPVADKAKKGNV